MIEINQVAADLHLHEVTHAAHGYTQGQGRNGSGGTETVHPLCIGFDIPLGDRDCSSSGSEVWKLALSLTPFKGRFDLATYTGNVMTAAKLCGCFEVWDFNKKNLAKAGRGDILLVHDTRHGHMGIYQGKGKSSEFLGNERGGIIGGKVGDQTGRESVYRNATDYPHWRYILHYNGKANLESLNFEVKRDTNVRTGRNIKKYRKVGKLRAGDVIAVDKIRKDADGRIWGHIADTRYRWFVMKGTEGAIRAIATVAD